MRAKRKPREPRLTRNQGTTININGTYIQVPYKKAKKAKVKFFPENIANNYAKAIQSYFVRYEMAAKDILDRYSNVINDSEESDALNDMLKEINSIKISTVSVEQMVFEFGNKIIANQNAQYSDSLKSAVGINIITPEAYEIPMLDEFIATNTNLIKTIQGDLKERVRSLISEESKTGISPAVLTDKIQKITKQPKWMAERIARTETNKFFNDLDKAKSKELGLNRFVWHTARDGAVRDAHEVLEGKIFSYDLGANGDFPGKQPNCRCTSTPYFDDLFSNP